MPDTVLGTVYDRGTIYVTVTFSDDGEPFTPKTLNYTLTAANKTVVNGRRNVPIVPPQASNTVALYGDDTDHDDGSKRRIIFNATYDSAEGNDLPVRVVGEFPIKDID